MVLKEGENLYRYSTGEIEIYDISDIPDLEDRIPVLNNTNTVLKIHDGGILYREPDSEKLYFLDWEDWTVMEEKKKKKLWEIPQKMGYFSQKLEKSAKDVGLTITELIMRRLGLGYFGKKYDLIKWK